MATRSQYRTTEDGLPKQQIDCGKKRYSTYERAVAMAVHRTSIRAHHRADILQPYRCYRCAGYHITSKPWRSELARFPVIEAAK